GIDPVEVGEAAAALIVIDVDDHARFDAVEAGALDGVALEQDGDVGGLDGQIGNDTLDAARQRYMVGMRSAKATVTRLPMESSRCMRPSAEPMASPSGRACDVMRKLSWSQAIRRILAMASARIMG